MLFLRPGCVVGSGPAPSLPLTFRNLCRRKANQLVSIFSATDSVLEKAEGWGPPFTQGSGSNLGLSCV